MAIQKKTAKPAKKAAISNSHKAGKKVGNIAAKKSVARPVNKKVATKPVTKKTASSKKSLITKKTTDKNLKSAASKKTEKLIKKTAADKNAVTRVAKKAAPKKLKTPVKTSSPPKKVVSKNKITKKPTAKKVAKASAKKEIKKSTLSYKTDKPKSKKAPGNSIRVKKLPKAKDIKVPSPKQVMLPKITATRSRKYEPEFTKSVLDQAPPENNGPSMRYSDAELNEFRDLIQRKLETAKKELGYLQGLITRKDEMGGDDTDNRYMTMEDGSLSMEREQLSQMASRQITFIDHLEKAMMRIENKTYGICRVTGKLIDKARLRAVPHATLSIEAKMGIAR